MLLSSSSLNFVSSNKLSSRGTTSCSVSLHNSISCSNEDGNSTRRLMLLGIGVGGLTLPANPLLAEEGIPERYSSFVDKFNLHEFDFRGTLHLKTDIYNCKMLVSFIPTQKNDIRDLGPNDEVAYHLVKHRYATPDQVASIYTLAEKTVDDKNYYTIEYELASNGYSTVSFATIAISNGRYYTLIVSANERRWRRLRNQLKVVADSFQMSAI